ncbi:unnamed protein product [Choristocarpus tenellus]
MRGWMPPFSADDILFLLRKEVLGSQCCYVVPSTCYSRCLPEFQLLCASGPVAEEQRSLEASLEDLASDDALGWTTSDGDVLQQLEAQMEEEVVTYLERIWQEIRPEEQARLQDMEASSRHRSSSLAVLRGGVDDERSRQEAVLRGFRSHRDAPGGVTSLSVAGGGAHTGGSSRSKVDLGSM